MATNHTPILGLCQWEPTDPVLRVDFNSDNQKIDAAFGAIPWVKLLDITTTTAASAVDISMEGIDLTKFLSLIVYVLYTDNKLAVIRMRINNISNNVYHEFTPAQGSWDTYNTRDLMWVAGIHAEIVFGYDKIYMGNPSRFFRICNLTAENIQSLNFIGTQTDKIPAGTRFIIWGVKK